MQKTTDYQFNEEYKVWQRPDYNYRIPYSDGTAVEERIYQSVLRAGDLSSLSDELEKEIFDWVSLCSLSKKRANLLRPFVALFKGKKILEPGCGAGPITRFLGECGAVVHAVEPSMERARIAAERCRDLPEVTVFCDDLESFSGSNEYDGIIQVGVLEYATKYSKHPDEPQFFLSVLKSLLKKDGFMITAIENQLGLKYLSGFAEDHNGVLMHNVNDNYQRGEANTWGRKQLLSILADAGFPRNEVFLPFPDYKLPSMVVYPKFEGQEVLGREELQSIFSNISFKDQQKQVPLFSLDKSLPLVAANGLLGELTNSFCVLSWMPDAVQREPADILLQQYATERRKEFCKSITFHATGTGCVIERSFLSEQENASPGLVNFPAQEKMLPGVLHHFELVKLVNRESWTAEQVAAWLREWIRLLQTESDTQLLQGDKILFDKRLPGKYLDAIPINVLQHKGKATFIDLELDNGSTQPLSYLLFRALFVSLTRLASVARPAEHQLADAGYLMERVFRLLDYPGTPEELNHFYEEDATLARAISTTDTRSTKDALSSLRVRPSSQDLVRINEHQADLNALKAEILRLEELERMLRHGTSTSVEEIQQLLASKGKEHLEQLLKSSELLTEALQQQQRDQQQMEILRREKEQDQQQLDDLRTQQDQWQRESESLRQQVQHAISEQQRLDKHNKGLEHEVYSLSTSRLRMIKSFIRQSVPFISKKPRKPE
ncbi:MAG: methyltransferase domain-containing protein [Chitinophagaceae bacterium]|nr:MAG: methyltransferase domain-containing protein [Chitinophagaceae bacterium]